MAKAPSVVFRTPGSIRPLARDKSAVHKNIAWFASKLRIRINGPID